MSKGRLLLVIRLLSRLWSRLLHRLIATLLLVLRLRICRTLSHIAYRSLRSITRRSLSLSKSLLPISLLPLRLVSP